DLGLVPGGSEAVVPGLARERPPLLAAMRPDDHPPAPPEDPLGLRIGRRRSGGENRETRTSRICHLTSCVVASSKAPAARRPVPASNRHRPSFPIAMAVVSMRNPSASWRVL